MALDFADLGGVPVSDSSSGKPDFSDLGGVPVEEGPGKLESFGRGAANNFPLAPQAIAGGEALLGNKGYSENLADWNQKAAAAKEANPVSYGAGAVTGAVAPLLIPGVGEALEAAPVAGNAALGAANAVSNTDVLKNPGQAAKQAVVGGALGAGTAAALGKFASMFSPVGDRLEANSTANALDLGTYGVRKLTKNGHNPESVLLGINKEINELMPGTVGPMDTSATKFQKLLAAHDAAGEAIGSVVDSVSDASGTKIPEVDEAIKDLREAASRYDGLTSARNADAKAELEDLVTRMEALKKGDRLNFRALADLKSDIGHAYHNPNLDNRGIDEAYSILSKKIDNVLDRATVSDPALKPTFDQAKRVYKVTSTLLPAMKRGVAREVAGSSGGLTNAALGAGAVFGHPLTAGAAYVGKTAAHLAAPEFVPNVAYRAVNSLRNGFLQKIPVKQALTQEMGDYLESKFGGNPQ